MAANAAAAAPAAVQPTPEQRLRAAAAREGDAGAAEVAALLLAGGLDVNAADADGKTALHEAADGGNVAAAMLLLSRGANVAAELQFDRWQPLHFAARSGHAAMVSLLLDHGADPSAADDSGLTPLLWAAIVGGVNAVRAFLDAGVPADARCPFYGDTPLQLAAGDSGLTALLLERGADVHATDSDGNMPLYSLMESCGDAGQSLELLLAAGADVNATNNEGETPLHRTAVAGRGAAAVRMLLAAGAKLEAADNGGRRPLHNAAESANLGAVRELLSRGADVHARNSGGATALHLACAAPHRYEEKADAIKALLEAGADAKAVDAKGCQPLHHLAAADCDPGNEEKMAIATAQADEAVALLKAAGAELDTTDAEGNTPLMLALKEPDHPAVLPLLRHGARAGPPQCGACADLDAKRDALRSLAVGAAAEVARLRQEREAWKEERAVVAAVEAGAAAAVEVDERSGKRPRRDGGSP